jgi:hypothetical protein
MHKVATMRILRWPLAVILLLGAAAAAPACTIPVFRYALERWELSAYEAVVFHRGDLSVETRSFLDSLTGKANLILTSVDLEGKLNPNLQKLWDRHGKPAALPWVVVRRVDAGAKVPPVWTGPFERETLQQFIDSPARQKIVTALSGGASGVFVLLLSGDKAADAAARTLLERQLAHHEKLVKLPEQRGEGPRIRLALPLKVAFTILPLRRDEPGEAMFVHLLLGSDDGLDKVRGPIAFPIIGRGRLLGNLHSKELDADTLYEVVSFLCGECSCQVKELNPGMDLPISADWPAIFERIGPAEETAVVEAPPGLTRLGARAKPYAEQPPVPPGTSKPGGVDNVRVTVSLYPASPEPTVPAEASPHREAPPMTPATPPAATNASHRRWLWFATIAASVLVVLTGAWACVHWRRGCARSSR